MTNKFHVRFIIFFILVSFVVSNFTFLQAKDIDLNTKTMPVINLTVKNYKSLNRKNDYVAGTMEIVHDKYGTDELPMQIKVRGNSTAGQPKKPFHVKLDTSFDLFGMGKNKHWLLLADALDRTHLRNRLAFDLSQNLGVDFVKSTYAEVYLNGDYIGLYMFCEQIRVGNTRVDIYDWEGFAEDVATFIGKSTNMSDDGIAKLVTDMRADLSWISTGTFRKFNISDYYDISNLDITGGYLIENDDYFDEISKFRTDNEVLLMIQEPEYANTNPQMFSYIENYMQDMEDAIYSKTRYNKDNMHYTEYMDLESFIDFWIVFEAFKNVELLYKSCYMYKDIGEKLVFGPVWDFDWSSGNHVNLHANSGAYDTWEISESQNRRYWYIQLFSDPFFMTRLKERWNNSIDMIYGMILSIDTYYEFLSPHAEKNIGTWGNAGMTYKAEVLALKNWLLDRVEWMTAELKNENPNILNRGWKTDKTIEITHTQKDDIITFNIKCTEDTDSKDIEIYLNGILQSGIELTTGTGTFALDTSKAIPNQLSNDNSYKYEDNVIVIQKYEGSKNAPSAMNYEVFKIAKPEDNQQTNAKNADVPTASLTPTAGTPSVTSNSNFLIMGIAFSAIALVVIAVILGRKFLSKKTNN
jgi:Spore coat assembly protein